MLSKASIGSHPIHPMLVAFPIGLWVTSFVFDILGAITGSSFYWNTGFYMVIAGCVGAALAAVPGVIDLLFAIPPASSAKKRGFLHGGLNTIGLILFIFVAAHRGSPDTKPDTVSLLGSLIAVAVVGFSGWLGGTLVYRNQIGIDHRYANAGHFKERRLPDWSRPVCNQGELSEGQMMLARVGTERVVVGRCPEGLFAFADHCTHKGGPLHDGALVGCTVQCPWHGSQFDIRSGRVVAGPAKHQIQIYAIDVRQGEVYVTPKPSTEEKKAA